MRRFLIPLHRRDPRTRRFAAGAVSAMLNASPPRVSRSRRLLDAQGRTVGGLIYHHDDDLYGASADSVIDDPREPQIDEIGLLDSRGVPLVRVTMPVKVPMGFATPGRGAEVLETVEFIAPADNLAVTEQAGQGVGWVDLAEVEAEMAEDETEDGEDSGEAEVEASEISFEDLVAHLRAQGLEVKFKAA